MILKKQTIVKLPFSIIACLIAGVLSLNAQDNARFVDPFIGTDKSDCKTVWGQYGGTYPGAVAPWGAIQLSPETGKKGEKGYFYQDTTICYFSCVNHNSGYPKGSHGNIRIAFAPGNLYTETNQLEQTFRHENEKAFPGYYGVKFDDGSEIEATVTTHTGMFRYHPVKAPFIVSVADAGVLEIINDSTIIAGRNHAVFQSNLPWNAYKLEDGELLLEFRHLPGSGGLLWKAGFSSVDKEGSRNNLETECPDWNFDVMKANAYRDWNHELSVVCVDTAQTVDCKKFYTALYHSFLIPYIISDVDGRYRGADRQVYQATGKHEYGRFSTWDTFRSLHPLLCLLKPQRQSDMLTSMLHLYDQQGYLPYTPMIGYHSIPVFTDSYVKGITAFDTDKAYEAMRKFFSVDGTPRKNTYPYMKDGFLNDSIDESVSVTLDYAYNDWALSVFADRMGHAEDAAGFRRRAFNYRNLFDPETRFMLPRNAAGFIRNPGEMGYKEANKWTASWFVPHNIQDLINLSGGDRFFTEHLQKAMENGYIIHDNEPVLNYPFLFSYAGRPDLTCRWVDHIRETCYTSSPGGIPGNDDLGSMSSWFVFSAMGFYPACPGRPEYVLTTPLFSSVTIYTENGRNMRITSDDRILHHSFSALQLNGEPYNRLVISHEQLTEGGELYFESGARTDFSSYVRPASLTIELPAFQLKDIYASHTNVIPHQEAYVYFKLENIGATGAYPVVLMNEEQRIASKLVWVEQGTTVTDSLLFRLYPEGNHSLSLSQERLNLQVDPFPHKEALICNSFIVTPLVKTGEAVKVHLELQNISGKLLAGNIPLLSGDSIESMISYKLSPGKKMRIEKNILFFHPGFHYLKIADQTKKIKVYDSPLESCVLDIDFNSPDTMFINDLSGFENHGIINGPAAWMDYGTGKALQITTGAYIAFPLSESLNTAGKSITLSAWVYPMKQSRGYVDFFTKGDYTVLQTTGSNLAFFAGGWGRGDCATPLPPGWLNNWHHVAGVCDGNELRLYIDGILRQSQPVEGDIEQTEVPWNLGRNAEMPYSRRFEGRFGGVKIFKEALSDQEIENLYKQQK